MAGDEEDLDAFFDDVQEAEASAVLEDDREEDNEKPEEPPPAKKQKKEAPAPPVRQRPRGVVVAAASNKTTNSTAVVQQQQQQAKEAAAAESERSKLNGIPPPPPPPKPAPQVVGPAVLPPHQAGSNLQPPAPSGRPHVRAAAGKTWVDSTLADWPEDDFRIFVGNLESQVSDEHLHRHFGQYASLNRVRVIRDPKGNSKGYGFVSLSNALECAQALREKDQTWLGNRPIRLKRSHWKDRELKERKKKDRGRKR